MARKIVAGNWKMNMTAAEGQTLIKQIVAQLNQVERGDTVVIAAPPMHYLHSAVSWTAGSALHIAAQNCSSEKQGAFTGEVSTTMLKSSGLDWVIIGHSERREYYGETDASVNAKLKQALEAGLHPIVCVGESLEERKADRQREVVGSQLSGALKGFSAGELANLVIAYEPVWAIGTGESASPEQAQEMHAYIRQQISEHFDAALAQQVSILYGGSVKPANAREIFRHADVDGGLIGGASLDLESFTELIKIGAEVL